MDKKVLSSSDVRKIIEHIWNDNDFEYWAQGLNRNASCKNYLDITFYTYKRRDMSSSYALIRTTNDASQTPAVDYSDKTARLTFVINEEKSDMLDLYVQKLRTRYAGKSLEFEFVTGQKFRAFVTIGTLTYDRKPEAETIGRALLCNLDILISFDRSIPQIKYEMALIDNPFDLGSINTRWFENQTEQQAWFNNKVEQSTAPYVEIQAPNTSAINLPSVTYYAPNIADLNSILSKNYAVIRSNDRYWYYSVVSASAGADNQAIVSLQMDSIQTYFFDAGIKIADCDIYQAHLDRFNK